MPKNSALKKIDNKECIFGVFFFSEEEKMHFFYLENCSVTEKNPKTRQLEKCPINCMNCPLLYESLTCLMACWTLSRLISLASLSNVFSSSFSIDTLYWHNSTTTTSGCTARIVCSRVRNRIKSNTDRLRGKNRNVY